LERLDDDVAEGAPNKVDVAVADGAFKVEKSELPDAATESSALEVVDCGFANREAAVGAGAEVCEPADGVTEANMLAPVVGGFELPKTEALVVAGVEAGTDGLNADENAFVPVVDGAESVAGAGAALGNIGALVVFPAAESVVGCGFPELLNLENMLAPVILVGVSFWASEGFGASDDLNLGENILAPVILGGVGL
jgi:hypothetical protein